MADRVVSDQQLDEWEADGLVCSLHAIHSGHINALIGEVRASHAREAEARQAQAHTVAQFSSSAEAAKRCALEAERDVLQQRIDKALAMCDTMDSRKHMAGFVLTVRVRAALTGGEQDGN